MKVSWRNELSSNNDVKGRSHVARFLFFLFFPKTQKWKIQTRERRAADGTIVETRQKPLRFRPRGWLSPTCGETRGSLLVTCSKFTNVTGER